MTHSLLVDEETYSRSTLGFWVYLMTDCILFSVLFTAYWVLHKETFGGPGTHDLLSLPLAVGETFVLLFSSFASGLGMIAARRSEKNKVLFWFAIAFLLGLSFVVMEVTEFTKLVREGNSWSRSAFLSSYFTLVGTHGFHVSIGLLWMIILMIQVLYRGIIVSTFRKLVCLSMFWHFLDLVWIFLFTVVYLMGVK